MGPGRLVLQVPDVLFRQDPRDVGIHHDLPRCGLFARTIELRAKAGRTASGRSPISWPARGLSPSCSSERAALDWIEAIRRVAQTGLDSETVSMTLANYGDSVMPLALRGLEGKTLDPCLAGWRKRVVPAAGTCP
jgi:hypothetical protein